jgi:hypothetical protein
MYFMANIVKRLFQVTKYPTSIFLFSELNIPEISLYTYTHVIHILWSITDMQYFNLRETILNFAIESNLY